MTDSTTSTPGTGDRPGAIDAVPLRHYGRWVAIVVIAVLAAMLAHLVLSKPISAQVVRALQRATLGLLRI